MFTNDLTFFITSKITKTLHQNNVLYFQRANLSSLAIRILKTNQTLVK